MVIGPIRTGWQNEAACGGEDTDLFFSESRTDRKRAMEICQGCPVRTDCLNSALARGEKNGIWGGLGLTGRKRVLAAVLEDAS